LKQARASAAESALYVVFGVALNIEAKPDNGFMHYRTRRQVHEQSRERAGNNSADIDKRSELKPS
jgi:hypothetical protein